MSNQASDEKTSGSETIQAGAPGIVIDGAYLRRQARDAMLTFIAPLNGVYAAAAGLHPSNVVNDRRKQKKEAEAR